MAADGGKSERSGTSGTSGSRKTGRTQPIIRNPAQAGRGTPAGGRTHDR
jgi:hypothetical protein